MVGGERLLHLFSNLGDSVDQGHVFSRDTGRSANLHNHIFNAQSALLYLEAMLP